MKTAWQARTQCRKCTASLAVIVEPGNTNEPSLAIFYCPACGERTQLEVPTGFDPLGVSATLAED
jgi:transcription elongation factor Elf1